MVRRRTIPPAQNRSPAAGNANRILAALPSADYSRVLSSLEVVPLKLKHILQAAGEPHRHVYFPTSGFLSVLTVLTDGRMVEVATIGREGIVGVSAALHDGPELSVAMVQAESDACYRMTAAAFRRELDRQGPFQDLVARYSHALMGFIMQGTACNAVHSVEQRLARWLLLAQDRVEMETFPLTQEFVAMMLGVTRPTVTVIASTLQKAGLIKYHRGLVTVVDRARLEHASCECYSTATELLRAVTNGRPGARLSQPSIGIPN